MITWFCKMCAAGLACVAAVMGVMDAPDIIIIRVGMSAILCAVVATWGE